MRCGSSPACGISRAGYQPKRPGRSVGVIVMITGLMINPAAAHGAAYSADAVMSAIVTGRKHLDPEPGRTYAGFVDMSGGSHPEHLASSDAADGTYASEAVGAVDRDIRRCPSLPSRGLRAARALPPRKRGPS
jgi:hypothetical protein